MPDPEIRIEIVPFPDEVAPEATGPDLVIDLADGPQAPSSPGGASHTEEPLPMDLAAVGGPPERNVRPDEPVGPDDLGGPVATAAPAHVEGQRVLFAERGKSEVVQPDPVQPDPVQPDPVQPAPAQPDAAQSALSQPERTHRPPAPGKPRSRSMMRGASIASRMGVHTAAAVVFLVLVGLLAVWGVTRFNGYTRDLSDLFDGGEAVSALSTALRETAEIESVSDAMADDLVAIVEDVDETVGEYISGSVLDSATEAWNDYIEERRDGATPEATTAELEEALAATTDVSDAISERQGEIVDASESARRWAVGAQLVLVLFAALSLALMGRVIGLSITDPLRQIGRAIRRFGDGDHSIRAEEAFDEVGLVGRSFNQMAESVGGRLGNLSAESQRGTQLRMISEALDLAASEADIHRIVERAMGILTPGVPGELLLNDSTTDRLAVVATNRTSTPPRCPVGTVTDCPSMRGGKALTFDSSTAINACPNLRGRGAECSAVCIPVSVNGHMLGVLHVTGPDGDPPEARAIEQLEGLSGQIGARISAMRTLETTRLQASTDGLTGLANRRMLEARMADLLRTGTDFVVAVADLDKFKDLNDRYGHEVGDKALQLFASVLEQNVRDRDLVARYGGEEFVLVYPEMSVKTSIEVIDRIRAALDNAIAAANLPHFTVSVGVTHSSVATSVEALVRIADAGLFTAKNMGRNRVVFADDEMASDVFGQAQRGGRGTSTGVESR